jgi:cytoskeletal protein CcmA (bactofilin family)
MIGNKENNNKKDSGSFGGLNFIGNGTIIEGRISTKSNMRVDGKIIGTVDCTETLTIGVTGEINGDVKVKNATVGGKINGNITASDRIVLESKSILSGDLKASRLIIDEGAVFDGNCQMTPNKKEIVKEQKESKLEKSI